MSLSTDSRSPTASITDMAVVLGPSAAEQWLYAPEHLAMVLARYRAAAALIGQASMVLEFGCGEGIGARILAAGRDWYCGLDVDADLVTLACTLAGDASDGQAIRFATADLSLPLVGYVIYDAVVALDVIEHLDIDGGQQLVRNAAAALDRHGVCVIGTPNQRFDHLASERSRDEHVYTYTHDHLYGLMSTYFAVVQSFGMQDTSLHLGHPEARHYLLMTGICPR